MSPYHEADVSSAYSQTPRNCHLNPAQDSRPLYLSRDIVVSGNGVSHMPRGITTRYNQVSSTKSGPRPDWPEKLKRLRKERRWFQTDLAKAVGVTPTAVNRWEKGSRQPDPIACIKLGKLAGPPDCWFWWQRAGLTEDDLLASVPAIEARLMDIRMGGRYPEVKVLAGPRIRGQGPVQAHRSGVIMLPLLKDEVAAGRPRLVEEKDVQDFIVVPRAWIKHPEMTTLLTVRGDSMEPILKDGYVVAVDASVTEPKKLQHKMVVAYIDEGVTIKYLGRSGQQWVLAPENKAYSQQTLGPDDRIIGLVVWWYGHQE